MLAAEARMPFEIGDHIGAQHPDIGEPPCVDGRVLARKLALVPLFNLGPLGGEVVLEHFESL